MLRHLVYSERSKNFERTKIPTVVYERFDISRDLHKHLAFAKSPDKTE